MMFRFASSSSLAILVTAAVLLLMAGLITQQRANQTQAQDYVHFAGLIVRQVAAVHAAMRFDDARL